MVFVLVAGFYLWIAALSVPLSLHDGLGDRYNLLATAFLHFRLSVGPAPAAVMHLANPYDPQQLATVSGGGVADATKFNDDAMYNGQLYFVWGPAPALVLLVPLHLLGFEPSPSVTDAFYGIAGVGFALAALRVVIRRIGDDLPLWMCTLAAITLSFSSVVPFLMRTPTITIETLAGGYCFAMAGLWLASSALVGGRASRTRLVLMSLCFGLAANSRTTLWLTALLLIPVYLSLRSRRFDRALLTSLVLPVGICFLLFLGYNQARFDDPLEIGSHYQLTGYEPRTAPLGRLSYVPSGVAFYAFSAPRFEIMFPFIHLVTPEATPPAGLPTPEITGGLLPMAPIVVCVLGLPWIWRRRRALLGSLAPLLLAAVGVGLVIPTLPAYWTWAPTERYETDFATLLVLGALAAWLASSKATSGYRRRMLQVGGGLLAAWSCVAGFAISFFGSDPALAVTHPGTWRALEDVGSPISTALATVVGHPVIGSVNAVYTGYSNSGYTALGTNVSDFTLTRSEHAGLVVVSPDSQRAVIIADVELRSGGADGLHVQGPGRTSASYPLPAGGGSVEIPVKLGLGLNRVTLSPIASPADHSPAGTPVMLVYGLSMASDQ